MPHKLRGTGVALVTPMDHSGKPDLDGLSRLLDHVMQWVDYLVVLGTTGESATLTQEEKEQILAFVKLQAGGKPIVYGLGGNNTRSVINEIRNTDLEGVEAILSVSPYYNKPSQKGIELHYTAIADASPVPVILYNVPGRTGSNIRAETTLKLAEHRNIMGIKEASGDMEQCIRIAKGSPVDFLLISGDDLLTLPIVSAGGVGTISVLVNAYPEQFSKLVHAALENDQRTAVDLTNRFIELNPCIYEEGNPTGIKAVLSEMGVIAKYVRLPLAEASAALSAKIRVKMDGI